MMTKKNLWNVVKKTASGTLTYWPRIDQEFFSLLYVVAFSYASGIDAFFQQRARWCVSIFCAAVVVLPHHS